MFDLLHALLLTSSVGGAGAFAISPDVPNGNDFGHDGEEASPPSDSPLGPTHAWLPGETLYSYCSRHHRHSDHQRSSDSCIELFGSSRQDSAHNLPSRVAEFAARTGGDLGSAKHIVLQHTVLSFYLPFLTEPIAADALQAALHGPVQELRTTLGITRSVFRAAPPLKACETCMGLDQARFGVAYWHLQHQIPGVSQCLEHGIPLGTWRPRRPEDSKLQWLLPSPRTIDFCEAVKSTWQEQVRLEVSRVALAVAALAPSVHFDMNRLGCAYAAGLRTRGFVHAKSNLLRRTEVGMSFSFYRAQLAGCAEFSALEPGDTAAVSHVIRVLRAARPLHPLWHVPCIAWLFGTWQEFVRVYDAATKES